MERAGEKGLRLQKIAYKPASHRQPQPDLQLGSCGGVPSAQRLASIDGLRAVAVLGVIAYHANLLPGSIGSRGVDLFFVISGLCLSLPILRSGTNLDRVRFWIGRFWRIVPTYWVALAVFGLLALTSFGLPSAAAPKRPFELLSEAFFFTGFTPAYNSSFWTLQFESHWYVLFPFVIALFMRSRLLFFALLGALYVWYLSPVGVADAGVLPCFMLGVVAADLYLRGFSRSTGLVVAAVAFFALAVALRGASDDHGDPLWHLAAFFVVLAGLGQASKALSWRPLAFIGVASYSVYLIHGPVLAWAHDSVGLPAILAAVLSLALGILFWATVERPITSPAFRALVSFPFRKSAARGAIGAYRTAPNSMRESAEHSLAR